METAERLRGFEEFVRIAGRIRGGSISPIFRSDGSRFVFVEGTPDRRAFLDVDPETGAVQPLFDTARLRKVLEAVLGSGLTHDVPFDTLTFVRDDEAVRFSVDGQVFELHLETYALDRVSPSEVVTASRRLPRNVRPGFLAEDPGPSEVCSPDGRWALTERDHDLWLRSTDDDRGQRLTTSGSEGLDWQVDGAMWSPEGLRVTGTLVDSRHVRKVPVVHWLKPTEEVEYFPYSKAGGAWPHTRLHVLDILSGTSVTVDTGEDPELRLFPVAWLPDGSELLVAAVDRTCSCLRLLAVDPTSGTSRLVVDERQDTFVYGIRNHDWFRTNATLLPAGDRLLWLSERDGWRNLWLYATDGTQLARVTNDRHEIEQVVGVDEASDVVFYLAHADEKRPYDVHLCRARLDGSEVVTLTSEPGIHRAVPTPSKNFLLDTHSSHDRPPRVDLLDRQGRLVRTLHEADVSQLVEVGFEAGEEFTATAADGETTLWGVLYRPPGFTPTERYPVIETIYGGPQSIEHQRDFIESGKGVYARALAQLGFVTYAVDGRGTPGRGKAFQDLVHGRFGQLHVDDHVAVFHQLCDRYPFLDPDRLGVTGISWGGYHTIRSMLVAPETYKVGVAYAPVGDLFDHMSRAIEPYMGLPQRNREGYERASNLAIAERLEGKLLLVHGTSDVNATFSATMKLVEAFTRADRPYDLLVLPELDHALKVPGGQYVIRRAAEYFLEHLRPEQAT
ncbi:MAG TPA: DPP IV N-terminal domain-containing protein [Nitriliruptorales bacterium]